MSQEVEWRTRCAVGTDGTGYVTVDPDAVIGIYAVHGRIKNGHANGDCWTITHRPTGKAVWHVKEYRDAIRVAEWLDQEQAIPVQREEAFRWIASLSPSERTRLMVKLQDVAPRFVPE